MENKNIVKVISSLFMITILFSCADIDSEKEWGTALIYIPQATYGDNNYTVPNDGSQEQNNLNYSVSDNKVNIFLGVYRSGLMPLEGYSVKIFSEDIVLSGYEPLPQNVYVLPDNISVPDGSREKTFYLSVDLDFLRNNEDTDYALSVKITDPTRYMLNESISTVNVLIKTKNLLEKIDGGDK